MSEFEKNSELFFIIIPVKQWSNLVKFTVPFMFFLRVPLPVRGPGRQDKEGLLQSGRVWDDKERDKVSYSVKTVYGSTSASLTWNRQKPSPRENYAFLYFNTFIQYLCTLAFRCPKK